MVLGPPLRRSFYERDALAVAPELIGARLVHRGPGGLRRVARLTEVEAYLGDGSDPAAHSHVGKTPRNRSMFGPPGRLYAYRSYGLHVCVNVVCGAPGSASAVLLRAAEPLDGLETMRAARGLFPTDPVKKVACGPGRLAEAMGLTLEMDGRSLLRGPLTLHAAEDPPGGARLAIERGPRVGISRATELPYRYFEPSSVWVSAFRSGTARRRR